MNDFKDYWNLFFSRPDHPTSRAVIRAIVLRQNAFTLYATNSPQKKATSSSQEPATEGDLPVLLLKVPARGEVRSRYGLASPSTGLLKNLSVHNPHCLVSANSEGRASSLQLQSANDKGTLAEVDAAKSSFSSCSFLRDVPRVGPAPNLYWSVKEHSV